MASIIPEPGYGGIVRHEPVKDRELKVVITFAGPAAQRRSHPRSDVHYGATYDREVISLAAEVLFAALHDRDSFIRRADREARALIERHWLAVDLVARALMQHKAMSGRRLAVVIEEAEAEWAAVTRPGLTPHTYARERALARQGPPPLRRQHIEAAALRLSLAGRLVTEDTIADDLAVFGHREADVRHLWRRTAASPERPNR